MSCALARAAFLPAQPTGSEHPRPSADIPDGRTPQPMLTPTRPEQPYGPCLLCFIRTPPEGLPQPEHRALLRHFSQYLATRPSDQPPNPYRTRQLIPELPDTGSQRLVAQPICPWCRLAITGVHAGAPQTERLLASPMPERLRRQPEQPPPVRPRPHETAHYCANPMRQTQGNLLETRR